jgi:hypothetical protein
MSNQARERKQAASLNYRDFNRLASSEHSSPENDSPGDTADDELAEIYLGQGFTPDEENEVLADSSAQEEDGETVESDIELEAGAVSSNRPDPIEDLDRTSSTH